MTDITIPPEALEAAKREYINCEDDGNCIEAACLAMLRAWPGMVHRYKTKRNPYVAPVVILPLAENTNAEG